MNEDKLKHHLKNNNLDSHQILLQNFNQLNNELDFNDLSFLGKISFNRLIKDSCKFRIRFKNYSLSNSGDIKIKNPIFVMGLPRSGTTYLHNLLIHFLNRDGLEFWELTEPLPYFKNRYIDIKFRKFKTFIIYVLFRLFVPKVQLMHPAKVNSFEECWHLFKHSLSVYNLDFQFGLNRFGGWLSKNNVFQAYKEYSDMLKILSHNENKKKLVLKCPEHMLFYPHIYDNFDDASFVWIHRDPVKVISSYSAMIYEIQKFFLKKTDKKSVGSFVSDRFFDMISSSMELRENNDIKVIDVNYLDIKKNPEEVIAQIANKCNAPIQNNNPFITVRKLKKLKSKYSYHPEDFGINKKEIYLKFKDYIEKFDIGLEP